MSVITWVDPADCDPPHGLDLTMPRHFNKVNMLVAAFLERGFDTAYSALVAYPLNGRLQLLSGTHRHEAAKRAGIKLPLTIWLRADIEATWGNLDEWRRIMQDIPVTILETWTRDDVEALAQTSRHQPHHPILSTVLGLL